MDRPIQIVMTPTRNEAWVIRAFLECNGLWADYIIIADQMSTDGTREIITEYQERWGTNTLYTIHHTPYTLHPTPYTLHLTPYTLHHTHQCQLILIDNTNPEFNEAERQAMLVAKAREVAAGRDTLLWGLDADEILPANWQETEDGKHILNSVKGDVFWFKWANLSPDKKHYKEGSFQPWLFHDDGIEPHGNYVRNMHSMRIPYPIEEKQMYYVNDFHVLHCGFLSIRRTEAKAVFYQFVDWELNRKSPISLSRLYMNHQKGNYFSDYQLLVDSQWLKFPFDFWNLINLNEKYTWYEDYVVERLSAYNHEVYKLDIWNEEFIDRYQLPDNRRWIDKVIHAYLSKTDKVKRSIVIRAIDKISKKLY